MLRARDLVVQGANGSTGPSGERRHRGRDRPDHRLDQDRRQHPVRRPVRLRRHEDPDPAVPAGAADTYAGDTASVKREIGPGVQVRSTSPRLGRSATAPPPGLIATLRQISADLKANNTAALGSTDLKALDAAEDNVSTSGDRRRTRRPPRHRAVAVAALEETTTKLLSDTEDADMAQTITDLLAAAGRLPGRAEGRRPDHPTVPHRLPEIRRQ